MLKARFYDLLRQKEIIEREMKTLPARIIEAEKKEALPEIPMSPQENQEESPP